MYSKMILYICGFWIQILPCAFYCLYPFSDRFRCTRRRMLSVIAAVLAVSSVCFSLIYVMSPFPDGYDYFAADLVFYAALAALLFIYIFLINSPVQQKLFAFVVVMNYGFLVTQAVSFVCNTAMPPEEEYIYKPLWLIIYVAVNAALFVPMLAIVKRIRQAFTDQSETELWWRLILIPLAFILVLIICYELPGRTDMDAGTLLNLFAGGFLS